MNKVVNLALRRQIKLNKMMKLDRPLRVVLASESPVKVKAAKDVLPEGVDLVCLGIENPHRTPQPIDEGGRACAELRLKDILDYLRSSEIAGRKNSTVALAQPVDAVIVMENYMSREIGGLRGPKDGTVHGRVFDLGYVMIYWMQEGLSYVELTQKVEIPDYPLFQEMMKNVCPGMSREEGGADGPSYLKGTVKSYGELLHERDANIPANNWTGTIGDGNGNVQDRGQLLSQALSRCLEQLRMDQSLLSSIRGMFRYYSDFPSPGVNFMDWHDIFLNANVSSLLIGYLCRKYMNYRDERWGRIDYILGLESRGYLLAQPMALELNCGFVPLRKPGKLPDPKVRREYVKEYGSDVLELRADLPPGRVVIVDDVLATGGSLRAAAELARDAGHTVVDCVVIRDVPPLREQAREHLSGFPVRVLIADPLK